MPTVTLRGAAAAAVSVAVAAPLLALAVSWARGWATRRRAARARALLRDADAVVLDVDSTVSLDEGIDVLAASLGVGDRVAELTRGAMGGGMLFQDALRARLELMRPSRAAIEALPPAVLSPGVAEFVRDLHAAGKEVFLVSGGFRQMIDPLAERIGLPPGHVVANNLLFGPGGEYAGFDETEPTSRTGGKARAVAAIKRDNPRLRTVVVIGDGVTDMEARPPADAAIGFGGVVVRPRVEAEADWFVYTFAELRDVVRGRWRGRD